MGTLIACRGSGERARKKWRMSGNCSTMRRTQDHRESEAKGQESTIWCTVRHCTRSCGRDKEGILSRRAPPGSSSRLKSSGWVCVCGGGGGGTSHSQHGVSVQARADYAPNWVAEHLGASSRRPRHPFPALMAGETPGRVPVYTALKTHPVNPRTAPVDLYRQHCDTCPST